MGGRELSSTAKACVAVVTVGGTAWFGLRYQEHLLTQYRSDEKVAANDAMKEAVEAIAVRERLEIAEAGAASARARAREMEQPVQARRGT